MHLYGHSSMQGSSSLPLNPPQGLGPELELELALVPMTERATEDTMKMQRPGTPVTHPTLPWHAAGH